MKLLKFSLGNESDNDFCYRVCSNFDFEEIGLSELDSGEVIYRRTFDGFLKDKLLFLNNFSYLTSRAFFDFCETSGKSPCLVVFTGNCNLLNEDGWLKNLINDGFNVENILLVGIRNFKGADLELLNKIRMMSVDSLVSDMEVKTDAIMEFGYGKSVYSYFDFSFLDSVFVPASKNLEVGGVSSREFLYVVSRMSKMQNLLAVDFGELDLSKDVNDVTFSLGKRVVEKFL